MPKYKLAVWVQDTTGKTKSGMKKMRKKITFKAENNAKALQQTEEILTSLPVDALASIRKVQIIQTEQSPALVLPSWMTKWANE